MNAYAKRFVRSIKKKCLSQMIPLGKNHLRRAAEEFMLHYHGERNHQGLGNSLIEPKDHVGQTAGEVKCRNRLGCLLSYYYQRRNALSYACRIRKANEIAGST